MTIIYTISNITEQRTGQTEKHFWWFGLATTKKTYHKSNFAQWFEAIVLSSKHRGHPGDLIIRVKLLLHSIAIYFNRCLPISFPVYCRSIDIFILSLPFVQHYA